MKIGLDYDGTVTSDYQTFLDVAKRFMAAGHQVYIVTMRYPSECFSDLELSILAKSVTGVIPTSRMAKRARCLELGVKIDVWIDDNPEAAYLSAEQIWGSSSPEGSVVIEDHGGRNSTLLKIVGPDQGHPSWGINWVGCESSLVKSDCS